MNKIETKEERGSKEWYLNGKLHREGGYPAIEFSNGSKG